MTAGKDLSALLDKLDVVSVVAHKPLFSFDKPDVAHIALIGHPEDVLALEDYFNERTRQRTKPVQLCLDLGPYLPLR